MKYNDIQTDVIDLIEEKGFENKSGSIAMDDHLKNDLQMDSLDILELEVQLENKYEIKLDLEYVDAQLTVSMIVNKIHSLKCDEA
ncbi:MAG: acyl carrier protein [Bacteroidia bacterium]|nr:acyl carrier protein [Bacteroidia bacterium]